MALFHVPEQLLAAYKNMYEYQWDKLDNDMCIHYRAIVVYGVTYHVGDDMCVREHSVETHRGYIHIDEIIQHVGNDNAKYVWIAGTWYEATNRIDTDSTAAEYKLDRKSNERWINCVTPEMIIGPCNMVHDCVWHAHARQGESKEDAEGRVCKIDYGTGRNSGKALKRIHGDNNKYLLNPFYERMYTISDFAGTIEITR